MLRVKASQLTRARGGNEMSQSVAARMTRNKLRADWDAVRAMLTDPKTPRREVWADMVLANPPAEYARVARDILPAETPDDPNSNAVVNNIQACARIGIRYSKQHPLKITQ
jgi:hypothetical protein